MYRAAFGSELRTLRRVVKVRAVIVIPFSIMSKSAMSKRRVFRHLKINSLFKRATITVVSICAIMHLVFNGSHRSSRNVPNIWLPEKRVKYGGAKIPFMFKFQRDNDHMHGVHIGEINGIPHWTPTPLDFAAQTEEEKQKAHTNCSFNRLRSDSLPLDRQLPDARPKLCKKGWFYQKHAQLPTTSVVIVFYNEPLSTLLRSIHSVLNRTPPNLLKEIILVDDGSDSNAPWLLQGGDLDQHLDLLPKTVIARLAGRNGLMAARNSGASLASGDTITFLDCHVEVGPGWIQPLLGRIAEGLREGIDRVVVPSIDSIDADSFEYKGRGIDVLGHSWGLTQTGLQTRVNQTDATPLKTPIMAGGLLSLSTSYFDKLGFYDPEMRMWGGEEVEISFRIWLCGGTLEWVPCSRVGHVFRSDKHWQGSLYTIPDGTLSRNRLRAAFWMGEYRKLYEISMAPLPRGMDLGDMSFYEDIQKRLQCRPFKWYLDNVNTELLESARKLLGPGEVPHFPAVGYMRNNASGGCVDHLHEKGETVVYGIYPCHYLQGSQSVVYTRSKMIISGEFMLDGCLTKGEDSKLYRMKCADDQEERQTWDLESAPDRIGWYVTNGGECLTVANDRETNGKSDISLRMRPCGEPNTAYQTWDFENLNQTKE